MNTKKLGELRIDMVDLQEDLKQIANFYFSSTYSEFICGVWESCALWNKSGLPNNTVVFAYEGQPTKTLYAEQLPYISNLIQNTFYFDHLKLIRLVRLKNNSVIIPHKDFLETEEEFLRFHIPLQTDESCFNSEEDTVYHMKLGEIWHLNASLVHSAASFSPQERLHLILDFEKRVNLQQIIKIEFNDEGIPPENIIEREELKANFFTEIKVLSKIINQFNFIDILAILIKTHFTKNLSAAKVFYILFKIAEESEDPALIEKAKNLYSYCMLERDSSLLGSE